MGSIEQHPWGGVANTGLLALVKCVIILTPDVKAVLCLYRDTTAVKYMLGPLESLPPMVDNNSRILILGTMPAVRSLEMGQYYADGRNHFWKVIFPVFGATPQIDYRRKVSFLLSNRIALWDVLKYCTRDKGKDSSIRNEVANDFNAFFAEHRNIRYIVFNGEPPREKFDDFVPLDRDNEVRLRNLILPSTSGRNMMPLDDKIARWRLVKKLALD